MTNRPIDLERFRLGEVLGEGAELQVFSARDTDTGLPVVVKRPHPSLIARSQHGDVERRLQQVISLREALGESLLHVPRLVAHSLMADGDAYFGDSLDQDYTVTVEERARGLPLVGSAVDGIKGVPIGLPHNLFALHPLVPHREAGRFTIPSALVDLVEAFHDAGALLLDLRPENVFFDPKAALVTVVDVGSLRVEQAPTRRRAPLDLHDAYLEVFKWYTTPSGPPDDPAGYQKPAGPSSVSMFARDLAGLEEEFSRLTPEPARTAALGIVNRISQRGYGTLGDFREDLAAYLELARDRYGRLREDARLLAVWREALSGLGDPYWRKFLFDTDADLRPYGAA